MTATTVTQIKIVFVYCGSCAYQFVLHLLSSQIYTFKNRSKTYNCLNVFVVT